MNENKDNLWMIVGSLNSEITSIKDDITELRQRIDALVKSRDVRNDTTDKALTSLEEKFTKLADSFNRQIEDAEMQGKLAVAKEAERRRARQSINERVWAVIAATTLAIGQRALTLLSIPHPYELIISGIFVVGMIALVAWLFTQRSHK